MSRFRIRQRLLKRLGGASKEIPMYNVTFVLPDGTRQTVKAEERYSLLMASQSLSSPISNGRRAGGNCPDGLCAMCRVEIIDSCGLSDLGDFEMQSMADAVAGKPHEGRAREPAEPTTPNSRLACHCRIIADGGVVKVAALVDYEALRGTETE